MSDATKALAELYKARAERDRLRKAVLDWMAAEGAKGKLWQNQHAPMWLDYEAAEKALDAVRERLGV